MTARRLPLWATLFTAAGVAALCGLGAWQVQRLHEKRDLLAALDRAAAQPPAALTAAALAEADRAGALFLRGAARGTFLHENEILVGPRTHGGAPGRHVVTPLILEDGAAILVDRGWTPLGAEKDAARPAGTVSVTGLARRPPAPNAFTPANAPDAGQWYSIAPGEIARRFALPAPAPYILYAEGPQDGAANPLPFAPDGWRPPDNHLQYALTWFALAAALLCIYVMKLKEGGK